MNGKDLTIGVLTVTAVILFVAVLLSASAAPQPVYASSQLDKSSQYIMFTSQITSGREMLSIIDVPSGLMNVYLFDINRGVLLPAQQIPLPPVTTGPAAPAIQLPAAPGGAPTAPAPGMRYGR